MTKEAIVYMVGTEPLPQALAARLAHACAPVSLLLRARRLRAIDRVVNEVQS